MHWKRKRKGPNSKERNRSWNTTTWTQRENPYVTRDSRGVWAPIVSATEEWIKISCQVLLDGFDFHLQFHLSSNPFIHLSSSMKVSKFSKSVCSYHIYLTKVAGIILLPMQMVSLLHVYRRNQPSSGCRTVCRSDVTCVCRVSSSAAAAVLRERMPRMPSEPPLHRSEVVYPTMGRAPRPPAIVRRKEKARSVRIETGERRAAPCEGWNQRKEGLQRSFLSSQYLSLCWAEATRFFFYLGVNNTRCFAAHSHVESGKRKQWKIVAISPASPGVEAYPPSEKGWLDSVSKLELIQQGP